MHPPNGVESHQTVPICKDLPEFSDSTLKSEMGWGFLELKLDLTHLLGVIRQELCSPSSIPVQHLFPLFHPLTTLLCTKLSGH